MKFIIIRYIALSLLVSTPVLVNAAGAGCATATDAQRAYRLATGLAAGVSVLAAGGAAFSTHAQIDPLSKTVAQHTTYMATLVEAQRQLTEGHTAAILEIKALTAALTLAQKNLKRLSKRVCNLEGGRRGAKSKAGTLKIDIDNNLPAPHTPSPSPSAISRPSSPDPDYAVPCAPSTSSSLSSISSLSSSASAHVPVVFPRAGSPLAPARPGSPVIPPSVLKLGVHPLDRASSPGPITFRASSSPRVALTPQSGSVSSPSSSSAAAVAPVTPAAVPPAPSA